MHKHDDGDGGDVDGDGDDDDLQRLHLRLVYVQRLHLRLVYVRLFGDEFLYPSWRRTTAIPIAIV